MGAASNSSSNDGAGSAGDRATRANRTSNGGCNLRVAGSAGGCGSSTPGSGVAPPSESEWLFGAVSNFISTLLRTSIASAATRATNAPEMGRPNTGATTPLSLPEHLNIPWTLVTFPEIIPLKGAVNLPPTPDKLQSSAASLDRGNSTANCDANFILPKVVVPPPLLNTQAISAGILPGVPPSTPLSSTPTHGFARQRSLSSSLLVRYSAESPSSLAVSPLASAGPQGTYTDGFGSVDARPPPFARQPPDSSRSGARESSRSRSTTSSSRFNDSEIGERSSSSSPRTRTWLERRHNISDGGGRSELHGPAGSASSESRGQTVDYWAAKETQFGSTSGSAGDGPNALLARSSSVRGIEYQEDRSLRGRRENCLGEVSQPHRQHLSMEENRSSVQSLSTDREAAQKEARQQELGRQQARQHDSADLGIRARRSRALQSAAPDGNSGNDTIIAGSAFAAGDYSGIGVYEAERSNQLSAAISNPAASSKFEFGKSFLAGAMRRLRLPAQPAELTSRLSKIAAVSRSCVERQQRLEKEKARVKTELKGYDVSFENRFGAPPDRVEKEPVRPLYAYYRRLKVALERAGNGAADSSVDNEGAAGAWLDSHSNESETGTVGTKQAVGQRYGSGLPEPASVSTVAKLSATSEEPTSAQPLCGHAQGDIRPLKLPLDVSKRTITRDTLLDHAVSQVLTESRRVKKHSDEAPLESVDTFAVVGANSTRALFHELRSKKSAIRSKLHAFQEEFIRTHGRSIKYHRDILPIEDDYNEYKALREKIGLLMKTKIGETATKK